MWRDGERLWILFEAKTEELPANAVSASEVRQAGTHYDWVRNQFGWPEPERMLTALVSPKTTVDPNAAAIAGEIRLVRSGRNPRFATRVVADRCELVRGHAVRR